MCTSVNILSYIAAQVKGHQDGESERKSFFTIFCLTLIILTSRGLIWLFTSEFGETSKSKLRPHRWRHESFINFINYSLNQKYKVDFVVWRKTRGTSVQRKRERETPHQMKRERERAVGVQLVLSLRFSCWQWWSRKWENGCKSRVWLPAPVPSAERRHQTAPHFRWRVVRI